MSRNFNASADFKGWYSGRDDKLEIAYGLLDTDIRGEVDRYLAKSFRPCEAIRSPGWVPGEDFEINLEWAHEDDHYEGIQTVERVLFNALIEQFGGKI